MRPTKRKTGMVRASLPARAQLKAWARARGKSIPDMLEEIIKKERRRRGKKSFTL